MAGFIPGLQPTSHSQEKEFAQAYEDVLERYKGKEREERSGPWPELIFGETAGQCHNLDCFIVYMLDK